MWVCGGCGACVIATWGEAPQASAAPHVWAALGLCVCVCVAATVHRWQGNARARASALLFVVVFLGGGGGHTPSAECLRGPCGVVSTLTGRITRTGRQVGQLTGATT